MSNPKNSTGELSGKIVQSPCVRLCVLSPDGVCMGCYRTSDEIGRWGIANSHEKQAILDATRKRRSQAIIAR